MTRQVISFHYTLTDKGGVVIDSSVGQSPLIFLSGSGQMIPGLECVLVELKKGEKKTVVVPAKDAYGPFDQSFIFEADRSQLPPQEIKVGDFFQVEDGHSHRDVVVIEIKEDKIILDGNHPLAGKDLTFAVEILDARPATTEEIAHGHVHGAGGSIINLVRGKG